MALSQCRECGQPVSNQAKSCPKCGVTKPVARRSWVRRGLLYFAGFVVITGFMAALSSDPSQGPSGPIAVAPPQKSPKQLALESVVIASSGWTTGGFNTVMLFSAKVKNNGLSAVKDLKIACDLYSNSGTKVSVVSAIVYETLRAGKSISFKELNMGFINTQSARASCAVVDLTLL